MTWSQFMTQEKRKSSKPRFVAFHILPGLVLKKCTILVVSTFTGCKKMCPFTEHLTGQRVNDEVESKIEA